MKINDLITRYLKSQTCKKSDTVQDYRQRLATFEKYLTANTISTVSELTPDLIQTYTNHLIETNVSTNTKYLYLAVIKHFLIWSYQNAWLLVDLADSIQLPSWKRIKRPDQTSSELARIIKSVAFPDKTEPRDRAVIALIKIEKQTAQTVANLSVMDVDLTRSEIRLATQKKFIQLQKETLVFLKDYLKKRVQLSPKTDWLFVTNGGTKMRLPTIHAATKRMNRTLKKTTGETHDNR